eukprot:TRINITY_DN51708_c0_g1_i2.p1 TRINITY_DN51708_c0_g1~~TRINITY_DN51708_c0_g1_i2.p1  ORF type:complete len:189 (+),score=40.72 TRINITY_DN51708_c0_g1_i2:53-619(+)
MPYWMWKSDLRMKDNDKTAWEKYSKKDSNKIEEAYQDDKKKMKLSAKYKIDFTAMIQHHADDWDRQRPIKRIAKGAPSPEPDSSSDDEPPAKKSKKSKALSDAVVCFSGTLSQSRSALEKLVHQNGGSTSTTVTYQTTHLVSTDAEVKKNTEKILAANAKDVDIVSEDWLHKSIKLGASQPSKKFLLD